ncbi:MAG: hypothetical protein JWO63_208 [Frankiales bacterium]|nr:hypothetical protein [Frankiales bacterium]
MTGRAVFGRRAALGWLAAAAGALVLTGCGSHSAAQPASTAGTQPAVTSFASTVGGSPSGAVASATGTAPSASSSASSVGPTPSAKPVTTKGAGSVAMRIRGAGNQDFAKSADCAAGLDFSGTAASGAHFTVVGSVLTARGFSGVSGEFTGSVTVSGSLRVFTGAQGVATVKAQARC